VCREVDLPGGFADEKLEADQRHPGREDVERRLADHDVEKLCGADRVCHCD